MRKSQSATEFLITYGWALLALLIVGALIYVQVFRPPFACYKLVVDGHKYPKLEDAINRISTNIDVVELDEFERINDSYCAEKVLLCRNSLCFDAMIIVPVTETEWQEWYLNLR